MSIMSPPLRWNITFIITNLTVNILLPEFKHLDFLWLMKGDIVTDEMLQQQTENIQIT